MNLLWTDIHKELLGHSRRLYSHACRPSWLLYRSLLLVLETWLATEAMTYGEKLRNFAQFHGYQEVALTISKANDLPFDLKLSGPQRQTHVENYFNST